MLVTNLNEIVSVLIYCSLPGCAGGIASFLLGYKRGHYKNDKYIAKFVIEVLGSMITASFVTAGLFKSNYHIPISFMIGLGWANILQMIRIKITKVVEDVINRDYN